MNCCAIWGHHVDNHILGSLEADRRCRCGASYLARDGSVTRVRHTLSCFLGHHTYTPLTDRDGCREYVCVQCGHPLMFRDGADPYRQAAGFRKKVRYLCGLFGHRVSAVTTRDGWTEYACHCGHSFLKADPPACPERAERVEGSERRESKAQKGTTIRHPLVCVLLGHFVRYLTSRGGYDEFVCVNCGHPFCFARAGMATPSVDTLAASSKFQIRYDRS
jgi:hypothetical protein